MMKRMIFCCTVIFMSLLLHSCRHDDTDISSFKEVCFENEVLPVFVANCAISGCHNSADNESGLVFNSYGGVMQGITPNEPLKSEIYKAITDEWFEMMPPEKPLTKEQRTIIRLWIDQGAENNPCNGNK